jgi:endonuclease/exonuclease/phosphatase (EEP) superfamily protein YafD
MVKPTSSIDANEEKAKSLIRRFIPVFKLHQDEVNTMKDFIQQSPYPVIVGGDFNSVPNSYEYYTINSVLKMLF